MTGGLDMRDDVDDADDDAIVVLFGFVTGFTAAANVSTSATIGLECICVGRFNSRHDKRIERWTSDHSSLGFCGLTALPDAVAEFAAAVPGLRGDATERDIVFAELLQESE
jgi:hypothetical protein